MANKKLLTGVLVIGALAAGGYYFINSGLNGVVKAALEKYGSQVTQTDVSVRMVNISLTSGTGSVSGLKVGNPKSFVAPRAIDIGTTSIKVDTASVASSGPVVIDEIVIDSPEIVYEVNAEGKNNLQSIEQNVRGASPKAAADDKDTSPARNVLIKNLYIRNGTVGISHALLKGRDVKASLPDIHLKNIGNAKTGATPQEVAKKVLAELSRTAARAGAVELKKELGDVSKIAADAEAQIKDKIGGKIGGLIKN